MQRSRKLFIPNIGDELLLDEDWSFRLYPERRNLIFATKLDICDDSKPYGEKWPKDVEHFPITIPAGAVLIVDRFYIRQGNGDYSSVTFRLKKETTEWGTGRFWAKLEDVNQIVVRDPEE